MVLISFMYIFYFPCKNTKKMKIVACLNLLISSIFLSLFILISPWRNEDSNEFALGAGGIRIGILILFLLWIYSKLEKKYEI